MAMHRPSRQIEVFDISLMAVVTKAMGAFLVLFVLVLPYYTSDPRVDTTSAEAHEQLAKMRKEIEDLARQVGANSADADALQAAIRRMRGALSEADYKIDQLSKEANALSSQLQRARKELEDALAQAASTRAIASWAQVAEAEMEVVANRALQAQRAALVAEAEMELQANHLLAAQRQSLIAQAEGEQDENALLAVVRQATLRPKLLVIHHWTIEPTCATFIHVRFISNDDGAVPDGLNLQRLGATGEALTKRSDNVRVTFPFGVTGAGTLRTPLSIRALWRSEDLRGLTVAYTEDRVATACRIKLTTSVFNLETNLNQTLQQDLELPASAQVTLMNGIDLSSSSFRVSPPNGLDRTLWNSKKPDLQRNILPAPHSP